MNRKLKSIEIVVWFMILLAFTFIGCSRAAKMDLISANPDNHTKAGDASNLKVQDYFPKKAMKKYFTGGFENAGFTHIFDKFEGDKVQVKQLDTGTGVALVYQVTEKHIRKIFSTEVADGKFKDDYIGTSKANRDDVILQAPLVIGTKWDDGSNGKYEITGVNVEVKTPAGKFFTVEVTYTSGNYVSKYYYAKDIGLVKRSTIGNEDLLKKVE